MTSGWTPVRRLHDNRGCLWGGQGEVGELHPDGIGREREAVTERQHNVDRREESMWHWYSLVMGIMANTKRRHQQHHWDKR